MNLVHESLANQPDTEQADCYCRGLHFFVYRSVLLGINQGKSVNYE
jgi:hypothetical protein